MSGTCQYCGERWFTPHSCPWNLDEDEYVPPRSRAEKVSRYVASGRPLRSTDLRITPRTVDLEKPFYDGEVPPWDD